MQFAVQRFLEDRFNSQGLVDPDQYAIKLANAFSNSKAKDESPKETLAALQKIRSGFYKANGLSKPEYLGQIAKRLERKFKKKTTAEFPGGVKQERSILAKKPRTIRKLLESFRKALESRAVNEFWISRRANKLRNKPEGIAQALLSVFLTGVLDGEGLILREFQSGTGFVDVGVILTSKLHLIELKILKDKLSGPAQLNRYMELESRNIGWLFLIDARPQDKRVEKIPEILRVTEGRIHIIRADIHPVPPSNLK